MSKPLLDQLRTASAVQNLRKGDVVWVSVSEALDADDIATMYEHVDALLPEDVNLIVTRGDYVQSIRTASLDELLYVHANLEKAILAFSAARAVPV